MSVEREEIQEHRGRRVRKERREKKDLQDRWEIPGQVEILDQSGLKDQWDYLDLKVRE